MSIATALTALADDVSAAKAAITAKGGTAPLGTSDMADAIAAIPSGGGRIVRGSITPVSNTYRFTHNAGFDAYAFYIYATPEAAAAVFADTSPTFYALAAQGIIPPSPPIPTEYSGTDTVSTTAGMGAHGRGSVGSYSWGANTFEGIDSNAVTMHPRDNLMAGQTYNYIIWELTT